MNSKVFTLSSLNHTSLAKGIFKKQIDENDNDDHDYLDVKESFKNIHSSTSLAETTYSDQQDSEVEIPILNNNIENDDKYNAEINSKVYSRFQKPQSAPVFNANKKTTFPKFSLTFNDSQDRYKQRGLRNQFPQNTQNQQHYLQTEYQLMMESLKRKNLIFAIGEEIIDLSKELPNIIKPPSLPITSLQQGSQFEYLIKKTLKGG